MGALDCMSSGKMQLADSTEVFAITMSSNTTLDEPRRDIESQKGIESERHSYWWTILVDVPLIVFVLTLVVLFEGDYIPGFKAGFYCNDPALSHTFNGDTVSMVFLVCSIIFWPIIVILPIEYMFADSELSNKARLQQTFRRFLHIYRCYIFGLIFNLGIFEVMKGFMGRPRPTFFDLCEPDTGKTCTGNEFVATYTCTSTKYSSYLQNDAHRSYPSGHTSMSVHCALFVVWYLQRRAFDWRSRTVFVVPFIQLLSLTYAAIASLTRITDHRHHWWDVLTGFFVGVATALYAAVVLCKNFSWLSNRQESCHLQSSVRTLVFDTQTNTGSP